MWGGVYERTSVHAWVGSYFVCVLVWEREREREWASSTVFKSVILRYCGSWSLLFVLLCCIVLSCALLYRVVFLIGFDVLQPMCTDRGCFRKPQSISPITALAVRLTSWICYSPLFKLEHSLISCPWTTSVGSDWSACTPSQALCRLCTVCLFHNSDAVRVRLGIKNQFWSGTGSQVVKDGDS